MGSTVRYAIDLACRFTGADARDVIAYSDNGPRRGRGPEKVTLARQTAMRLLYEVDGRYSYRAIGDAFGRHYSTVISNRRAAHDRYDTDPLYAMYYRAAAQDLRSYLAAEAEHDAIEFTFGPQFNARLETDA